jgi:hypothetical protein
MGALGLGQGARPRRPRARLRLAARPSKLEHGDDALVSTLRRHIHALGGELRLMVEFPDRPSMAIDLHGDKPVAKTVRAIGSV